MEPLPTLWAGAGVCDSTVPAGFVPATVLTWLASPAALRRLTAAAVFRPTTLGTFVTETAETSSSTGEPRATDVPAPGVCAKTVPFGCLLGFVRTLEARPRWCSSPVAAAWFMPTTFGTVTAAGAPLFLLLSLSRVRKYAAARPPATSSSRSRSHGQRSGGRRRGGAGKTSSSSTSGGGAPSSTTVVRVAGSGCPSAGVLGRMSPPSYPPRLQVNR